MRPSLSHPAPSAHTDADFTDTPYTDTPCDEQLRGLTRDQLADRLRWLSWYAPGVFTAVMDFMEFTDALTADTGPVIA
jgi:hypothetical protein